MALFSQPNKVKAQTSNRQSYSIDQRIALTPTDKPAVQEQPTPNTFQQEQPKKEEDEMEYDF